MKIMIELKSATDLAVHNLQRIRANKNKLDLVILLLYLRILDYANSILRMASLELSPGIYKLVVRSVLESSAKQELLINDPKVFEAIEFSELKSEIDIIHSFKLEESSRFNSPEGQNYLNELKSRYKELKPKKLEYLGPNDIFKRIGAKDLHESIYKHLCQSPHSSSSALYNEYTEIDTEIEVLRIVPFPVSKENELFPHLHTCGLVLLVATIRTHGYFESGAEDDFIPLYQLFNNLRPDEAKKNSNEHLR